MDGSQWSSVQFSHSVVSNSLWPHRPQRAGPPCLSLTPRVYPNSCPLSRWCHPTILSSVVPFSSCPQSFPASGSFQMSQFFTSGGQNIGVSASTSILPQWRVLTKCGPQQNLDRILKSRDITWPTKVHVVKAMVFPVVMYRCESWSIKRAGYQRIDAFNCGAGEDSWESLDSKEIKAVHPKGNQPWIFIGRIDAEAPMLSLATWCEEPTHWKIPWCWERSKANGEAGRGWDGHRLNGCKFEQSSGPSGEQRSLACCSPWGREESYMT